MVVITGSTRGLGFGYAQAFLQRGHHVVISGRRQSSVDAAIDRLEADAVVGGGVAIGQACDVADRAQVQALWDFAVRSLGPVDIWLHSADAARIGTTFEAVTSGRDAPDAPVGLAGSKNSARVAAGGFAGQPRGGKLYLTLGGGAAAWWVMPGLAACKTTRRAVALLAASSIAAQRGSAGDRVRVGTLSPGVNVTEGLLTGIRAIAPATRAAALRQLGFVGDHVASTASWIVERILDDDRQRQDITWLTRGRLLRRGLGAVCGVRRDLLARYSLEPDNDPGRRRDHS